MNYDQNLVNTTIEESPSNSEVETTAFLVLTDNHIGVTNALEDIAAYIKLSKVRIFCSKASISSLYPFFINIPSPSFKFSLIYASNNTLLVPHKQKDFNLVKRNSSSKTPLTVVDIIKPYK